MGLFDGVKKVIGKVADVAKSVSPITSVLGDISPFVSAGLGLLGTQQANSASQASTREQMDFQERMRSTAYQTAVKDLMKAGLNPRLAYSQGGAAMASGAQYTAKSVAEGATNAMVGSATARNLAVQNRNIEETNNNLKTQQMLNMASANSATSQARAADAAAAKTAAETVTTLARLPAIKNEASNNAKEANSFFARVIRPRTRPFFESIGDATGAFGNIFRGSVSNVSHTKN